MRTETVTITTTYYEYDELSDSAKQNVKEWYLNCYRWPEEFSWEVKQDLENLFGKENGLDIEYQLNYGQGDGFNIYGTIDAKKILDFMGSDVAGELSLRYADALTEDEKNVIRGYCDYDSGYYPECYGKIIIPSNPHSYNNCRADSIDIADSWVTELDYYDVDVDFDLLKKFEDAVIDLFTELCIMYEKWGYEFFYEVSDDDMMDSCFANEWEFDEDGNLLD